MPNIFLVHKEAHSKDLFRLRCESGATCSGFLQLIAPLHFHN